MHYLFRHGSGKSARIVLHFAKHFCFVKFYINAIKNGSSSVDNFAPVYDFLQDSWVKNFFHYFSFLEGLKNRTYQMSSFWILPPTYYLYTSDRMIPLWSYKSISLFLLHVSQYSLVWISKTYNQQLKWKETISQESVINFTTITNILHFILFIRMCLSFVNYISKFMLISQQQNATLRLWQRHWMIFCENWTVLKF